MPSLTDLRLQARALLMLVASSFKRNWTVDDYPIHFRFHPDSTASRGSRLKPLPWTASIVNWPGMMGGGGTRLEALDALRRNFEQFKLNNKLPRPGTKVPIQFASTKRVDSHSALGRDFVKRVLDIDWAFISDESSLWDFYHGETNAALFEKIRSIYGVDVSDISSGNLADIFDRIVSDSRPI